MQMDVVVGILAAHAGIVIVTVKNRTGESAYLTVFFLLFVMFLFIMGSMFKVISLLLNMLSFGEAMKRIK
jgi:hypothetical protein